MHSWIFIDLTTISDLNALNFDGYDKVILFIPHNNQNVNFNLHNNKKAINMTLISVPVNQINTISLFISLYIGIFNAQADKTVNFTIMSHFSGFSDLILHMSDLGRECKILTAKMLNKETEKSNDCIDNALKKFMHTIESNEFKAYPKKLTGLRNSIKSIDKTLSQVQITTAIEKLKSANIISIEGQAVTFLSDSSLENQKNDDSNQYDYKNEYEFFDDLDVPF